MYSYFQTYLSYNISLGRLVSIYILQLLYSFMIITEIAEISKGNQGWRGLHDKDGLPFYTWTSSSRNSPQSSPRIILGRWAIRYLLFIYTFTIYLDSVLKNLNFFLKFKFKICTFVWNLLYKVYFSVVSGLHRRIFKEQGERSSENYPLIFSTLISKCLWYKFEQIVIWKHFGRFSLYECGDGVWFACIGSDCMEYLNWAGIFSMVMVLTFLSKCFQTKFGQTLSQAYKYHIKCAINKQLLAFGDNFPLLFYSIFVLKIV